MAGGKEKTKTPGVVVLSIRQENGRYTPELAGINSGEQPIYSAHGRNCIDPCGGVHLTRKTYRGEKYHSNVIEIRNPGHKEIYIVTGMGTQRIAPFPEYFDIHYKQDRYGLNWINLNDNISVDFDGGIGVGRLTVSFNKVNSRCDLRIFENKNDYNRNRPIIEARLIFVSIELGNKMIASEKNIRKNERFF